MGTPHAAVPSLERLITDGHDVAAVYTQPDRPAGRGQKLQASPVKDLAISEGLPVYQPAKLRLRETVETFRSHAADVAVVVAYGRILSADYLHAFSRGAINVHFSLLPKYRGAAPVNWAIAEGETETGVTTMKMDEGLDTGDILLQWKTFIGEHENAIDLMSRLADLGAEILSDTLSELISIQPRKQLSSAATVAPILKKEDGLIDWEMNARRISDRIRGFQPFPGAFTHFRDRYLKIWDARAIPGYGSTGVPGEVASAATEGLIVSCGTDALQLLEVQPEGKRRMSVMDFLNGFRVEKGEVFG